MLHFPISSHYNQPLPHEPVFEQTTHIPLANTTDTSNGLFWPPISDWNGFEEHRGMPMSAHPEYALVLDQWLATDISTTTPQSYPTTDVDWDTFAEALVYHDPPNPPHSTTFSYPQYTHGLDSHYTGQVSRGHPTPYLFNQTQHYDSLHQVYPNAPPPNNQMALTIADQPPFDEHHFHPPNMVHHSQRSQSLVPPTNPYTRHLPPQHTQRDGSYPPNRQPITSLHKGVKDYSIKSTQVIEPGVTKSSASAGTAQNAGQRPSQNGANQWASRQSPKVALSPNNGAAGIAEYILYQGNETSLALHSEIPEPEARSINECRSRSASSSPAPSTSHGGPIRSSKVQRRKSPVARLASPRTRRSATPPSRNAKGKKVEERVGEMVFKLEFVPQALETLASTPASLQPHLAPAPYGRTMGVMFHNTEFDSDGHMVRFHAYEQKK